MVKLFYWLLVGELSAPPSVRPLGGLVGLELAAGSGARGRIITFMLRL
jgi:hypothetical protein